MRRGRSRAKAEPADQSDSQPAEAGTTAHDLWSIPGEAVGLDDAALWADGDILNRLSAVLPGYEHVGPSAPGVVSGDPPSTRRRHRATAGDAPRSARRGVIARRSNAAVVTAIVVSAFLVAVLAGAVLTPSTSRTGGPSPQGVSTPHRPGTPSDRIVTDGPNDCPMYVVPATGTGPVSAPWSGGCFYVG
jgi:hypothetical protein